MRISDWSSDVCSSDLARRRNANARSFGKAGHDEGRIFSRLALPLDPHSRMYRAPGSRVEQLVIGVRGPRHGDSRDILFVRERSEEHTSELQSLMRISYAVFCLKKKKNRKKIKPTNPTQNKSNITTVTFTISTLTIHIKLIL